MISVPRKTDLASTFIADGVQTVFEQRNLREKEGYMFNFRETEAEKKIIEKINRISKPLSEYFTVAAGIMPYQVGKGTPPQTQEIVDTKPFESHEKFDDTWIPLIRGRNIKRYVDAWENEYIKYGKWLATYKDIEIFNNEKLLIRRTDDYPMAFYDISGKVGNKSTHIVYSDGKNNNISLKYILGLINSKLMKWVYQHENFHMVGKPLAEIKVVFVERFPIIVADNQSEVVTLVDKLLENCQARFDMAKQFTDYLTAMHAPKSITEKLSEFYKLDFKDFIGELKKQGVKLTPKQEMELMPLFQEKAKEITAVSQTVEKLDIKLDEVVFALYGLTAEERKIIEEKL